jgi:hypothetical protein
LKAVEREPGFVKICLTRFRSYDNINIATETTGNRITIEKYVISLIQSDGDKRICEVTATPA